MLIVDFDEIHLVLFYMRFIYWPWYSGKNFALYSLLTFLPPSMQEHQYFRWQGYLQISCAYLTCKRSRRHQGNTFQQAHYVWQNECRSHHNTYSYWTMILALLQRYIWLYSVWYRSQCESASMGSGNSGHFSNKIIIDLKTPIFFKKSYIYSHSNQYTAHA